jgi:hypothetical protein
MEPVQKHFQQIPYFIEVVCFAYQFHLQNLYGNFRENVVVLLNFREQMFAKSENENFRFNPCNSTKTMVGDEGRRFF